MTREEFMEAARLEADAIMSTQKNRIMNLVQRAWAEGKRNAEVESLIDVMSEAFQKIGVKEEQHNENYI